MLKWRLDSFSREINIRYLNSGDYETPSSGKGIFGFKLSKAE